MKKSRSLKWIFTMWLLGALIPALGTFVGMSIFMFRSVILENIQNIIKNNTLKYSQDVQHYFDERNTMVSVLTQVPSYRVLVEKVNQRFYFREPLQQDERVIRQSLNSYSNREKSLLSSIPVRRLDSPIDPLLSNEYANLGNSIVEFKKAYPDLVWLYIVNEKTQDVLTGTFSTDSIYLANRQPWYQLVKQRRSGVTTEPYYEPQSNGYTFLISVPIFQNQTEKKGEMLGAYVLNTGYSAFETNITAKWEYIFPSSFAYIVNSVGDVVYHPDFNLVKNKTNIYRDNVAFDTQLGDILHTLDSGPGNQDTDPNGNKRIVTGRFTGMNSQRSSGSFWVTGTTVGVEDWKLVIVTPVKEIEVYINTRFGKIWMIILLILVLLGLFIFGLTSYFLNPISSMTAVMQNVGRGDLATDKSVLQFKSRNEMGTLAKVMNASLNNFSRSLASVRVLVSGGRRAMENLMNTNNIVRGMASNITVNLEQAHEGSIELQNAAQRAATAAGSVRRITEEEAQLVMDCSAAVSQTSGAMEEMNAGISNMARIASESRRSSDQLIQVTREGTASMEELTETIESISDNITQMREVITIINEISQQTNLLAMNAAIEAAHAGESGKGFAVVADEIRQLAETTAENSTSIHNTLTTMVGVIEQAKQSSEENSSAFDQIERQVLKFVQAFSSIATSTEEISTGSHEINDSMSGLNDKSETLLEHTHNVQDSVLNIERLLEEIDNFSQRNLSRVSNLARQSLSIEILQKSNSRMSRLTFNNMLDLLKQVSHFAIPEDEQANFNMHNDFGRLFIELQEKRKEAIDMLSWSSNSILSEEHAGNYNGTQLEAWIQNYGTEYFNDYPEFRDIVEAHYDFYRLRTELVRLFNVEDRNQSIIGDITQRFERQAEVIEEKLVILQKLFYSDILPGYIEKQQTRNQQTNL
ncbi:methyl-accepting chemotaxis protein [Candidatus Haliotispira prima]|uniref:Methyl-accepting chemotaxis protein n=1 Tax=Candidatus Haliotispira prima TaxID=3034016 RepID=A0ABY8MHJ6_9SPIO|nr:methyl-accepting chemotaxis protein [Candidatus Haliotispira prima]